MTGVVDFLNFVKVGWEIDLNLLLSLFLHPQFVRLSPFVHRLTNLDFLLFCFKRQNENLDITFLVLHSL